MCVCSRGCALTPCLDVCAHARQVELQKAIQDKAEAEEAARKAEEEEEAARRAEEEAAAEEGEEDDS